MPYLWCVLMGYLAGSLNPSYFTAKLKGVDIRKTGSRNAGASNALILFGKSVGALCALFDIAKAALIIRLALYLFPETPHVFAVAASACILGHIFPFYMKFRGGKGLACLGGTILAYHPLAFAVLLTLEVAIVLLTKYICFVPITASVLFTVLYGVLEKDLIGTLLLAVVCVVIFCKHIVNLRRIRAGSELRITYLWNRDKEAERLRDVYPDGEPR